MSSFTWRDFAAIAYTDLGSAVYGPDLPQEGLLNYLRDALHNVEAAIQALEETQSRR
jgi:hypothetical protein